MTRRRISCENLLEQRAGMSKEFFERGIVVVHHRFRQIAQGARGHFDRTGGKIETWPLGGHERSASCGFCGDQSIGRSDPTSSDKGRVLRTVACGMFPGMEDGVEVDVVIFETERFIVRGGGSSRYRCGL